MSRSVPRRARSAGRGGPRFFAHPTALVETENIGAGTRIWAFAHVLKGAVIGSHCNVGDHAFIESGAVIEDHVTVKNGVMVWSGVTVRRGAFLGPGVVFTNDLRPRARRWPVLKLSDDAGAWLTPTIVEEGASLGANVTVVSGVTIGAFALVGAGSVVTRSVPPHALGYGCPFRVTGFVCACGKALKQRPSGSSCSHPGRRS